MPILPGSYDIAIRILRGLSPPFSRGGSKLAAGLRGRRHASRTLAAWGRRDRDPDRPLVWLHAPSVGEGLQAHAVLLQLQARVPTLQAAYTFFSPSAEPLARTLPADVTAYLPWDIRSELDALLADLEPGLVGFTKTEVWPALTMAAAARGLPVVLCAGTLEADAGRLRPTARRFLRPTFEALTGVFAVAHEDAERFLQLGVSRDRIQVTGDPGIDSAWARARQAVPSASYLLPFHADPRLTVVAGSTWEPDEEILLPVVARLAERFPGLRGIIAPHEPHGIRLARLEAKARRAGLRTIRLEEVERRECDAGADLVVVDRVGVLAHLYTIGSVAYVGGGFGRAGLHSVLEPAAAGLPVVFGPQHDGSRGARDLLALGAGEAVTGGSELAGLLQSWLASADLRGEIGASAAGYIERHRGAARGTAIAMERVLMGPDRETEEIPEISATELRERLERADSIALLDVREPHEREIADLPELGQQRIPLGQLMERVSELEREATLVVYCRSGSRSGWATGELRALGFQNVWNLRGGLLAWKDEVDPTIQAY